MPPEVRSDGGGQMPNPPTIQIFCQLVSAENFILSPSKSRNLAPIPLSCRLICRFSEQLGAERRRTVLLSFFRCHRPSLHGRDRESGRLNGMWGTTCKMLSIDLSSSVPQGYKSPSPSIIFPYSYRSLCWNESVVIGRSPPSFFLARANTVHV